MGFTLLDTDAHHLPLHNKLGIAVRVRLELLYRTKGSVRKSGLLTPRTCCEVRAMPLDDNVFSIELEMTRGGNDASLLVTC